MIPAGKIIRLMTRGSHSLPTRAKVALQVLCHFCTLQRTPAHWEICCEQSTPAGNGSQPSRAYPLARPAVLWEGCRVLACALHKKCSSTYHKHMHSHLSFICMSVSM